MFVTSNPIKQFGRYVQISRVFLKYGFGIMALSIFVFLVTNLPVLKILSILGLVFSFIIFITQIVISVMK
jgi:hypothetical protein